MAGDRGDIGEQNVVTSYRVFWGEAVAVIAFGIAWLIKGETLFADRPAESLPLRLAA